MCPQIRFQSYTTLDSAWRSTCKVVLGEDIGELRLYEDWLKGPMAPLTRKRSYLSGKEVNCAVQDYPADARFVSLDEVGIAAKAGPLSINDIKDMDSVIEALKERFVYCGNVVLGNSKDVEGSSDVQNSFHVLGSNFIYDCENIAYSSYCRGSKYLFCTVSDFSSSFLVRTFETHKQSRCFEAWNCYDSSDCYFSSFVENSQEAMFSFSLRNKRHVIGNIELPKDKYGELKAKLLSEIREELVRNRRLPSLMDIAASSAPAEPVPGIEKLGIRNRNEDVCDMPPIEEAFGKTTALLFGRPLHDVRSYEKWLMRHIPPIDKVKSAVSGRTVYMGRNKPFDLFLKDRLVSEGEILGGRRPHQARAIRDSVFRETEGFDRTHSLLLAGGTSGRMQEHRHGAIGERFAELLPLPHSFVQRVCRLFLLAENLQIHVRLRARIHIQLLYRFLLLD